MHLYGNRLTVLPEWLPELTGLETLWLHDNRITELPDSLRELANLKFSTSTETCYRPAGLAR